MAKDKKEKTNAMRRLDALKIQYGQHYYDGEEALSGTEVAAVLGQDGVRAQFADRTAPDGCGS